MATERKQLIKMKDAAKALTNEHDNLVRGHGSRKDVAEAFIELGGIGEEPAASDAGRESRAAVEKATRERAEELSKG